MSSNNKPIKQEDIPIIQQIDGAGFTDTDDAEELGMLDDAMRYAIHDSVKRINQLNEQIKEYHENTTKDLRDTSELFDESIDNMRKEINKNTRIVAIFILLAWIVLHFIIDLI